MNKVIYMHLVQEGQLDCFFLCPCYAINAVFEFFFKGGASEVVKLK